MKNITTILAGLLLMVLLVNCSGTKDDLPQATLKGYIKGIPAENVDVKIRVANSVTGDFSTYYLPVDTAGEFELTIPLAFPVSAGIESKYTDISFVYLSPGKTSVLNIDVDGDKKANVQIEDETNIPVAERVYLYSKMIDILMNTRLEMDSVATHDVFRKYMTERIGQVVSSVDTDTVLPERAKNILKAELNLFYTQNILMDYKPFMKLLIRGKKLEPQELEDPDISYYSFLKDVNMSDTTLISTGYYHMILQSILKYPVFEIKTIDETLPSEWLDGVKGKLDKVVGDGQGLFYDLLLANSYSGQLNQMKPFSDSQIKNIQDYYKEDNIGKVLLSENHKVNILLGEGADKKTSEYGTKPKEEAPATDQAETFMTQIFDKYKDKIIVVDFWATWCGPCLKSIDEIAPHKKGFQNKGVVFVYVTTESSPPKAWEMMKKNIKGEHYYVNEKVWDQLSSKYGFSSIPCILVFDKDHKPGGQIVGYMKDDKRLIDSLNRLL